MIVVTEGSIVPRDFWALPDEWKWISLNAIAPRDSRTAQPSDTPSQLVTYLGLEHVEQGQWTDAEYQNVLGQEIKSSCIVFDNSHVLYGKLRPYLNKVVVPSKQGFGSTEWIPLRPEQERLERGYLAWFLRSPSFVAYASRNVTGARMPRARMDVILEAPIPIPFPSNPKKSLDIQRRIVARIEALLAEVRSSRELLDEMQRDCDRVIKTALNEVIRKLDKEYPNSPTIKELIRDKKIKMEGGGTPSRSNASYWIGEIPWVSPKDMKSWYINDAQEHISEIALRESSAKFIPIGAILIVVRGMILIHTFPVAIAQAELAINQDMKALEPNDDFLPEYLGYILRARSLEILQKVEIAGHGTRRLKTETLNQVVIPSLDKNNQRRIVEYLNNVQFEVDKMLELMDQNAKTLDLLEQSILERAFRGEL